MGLPVIINYRRFQFHKGSIKTEITRLFAVSSNAFQFHKGSIKTEEAKVKLIIQALFQFHKGSIKTESASTPKERIRISIP